MSIKWFQELRTKYEASIAHSFILHFNVGDYVVNSTDLKSYLLQVLSSFDLVALYNRAEGITFPFPSMKEAFIQWMEIAPADPTLSALNFASGSTDTDLPREPAMAFPLLEKMLKLDRESESEPDRKVRSALIIDFAETLFPNTDISTMNPEDRNSLIHILRWGKDPNIARSGNMIILITTNLLDIHPAIRAAGSRIESITIQLPEYDERLAYINSFKDLTLKKGFTKNTFASMTGLLSKIHIEDIILRAKYNNTAISHQITKERKTEIIRSEYEDVLELVEPDITFKNIGGMEHIKSFFQHLVIRPIRRGNADRAPLGTLMMGAPGTGKTVMAEAVAKESGFNFVKLNLAKILGGIVGTTEKNTEKALKAMEGLAPCFVLIDEIDQVFTRGEYGDSGVQNRLFAKILNFMGNTRHRGKIIFLACTNRPDLLDPALKRPGRFDKKIVFLPPNFQERIEVIKAIFDHYTITHKISPETFNVFSERTNNWTGAEIEALAIKARELAEDRNSKSVEDEDILSALEKLVPTTQGVEYMTALALKEINDKDLLPPQYQQELTNRKELQDKIDQYKEAEKRSPRTL